MICGGGCCRRGSVADGRSSVERGWIERTRWSADSEVSESGDAERRLVGLYKQTN